jgi:peptidoglycan/LPS O-acetylase OafA/YrhL
MRAVAVLLVALNHAGIGFLSGGYIGVDVFFVLSGYLITGVLLSGAAQRSRISLAEFYARRAKRILPAATLTLAATAIAAYQMLNIVRAHQVLTDTLWASVFGANVHFAHMGTDYFAQGQPESPVRHFWSLAVEEQFYVVWPTLVAVVVFGTGLIRIGRRRRMRPRPPLTGRGLDRLFVLIAIIAAVSLYWSIHQTKTSPTVAYFSTFTRAWELALGAGLAVTARHLTRVPALIRVGMGWAGLAAIVVAAVEFDATTPFPGSAALVPTIGAALLIVAGMPAQTPFAGVGRLLSIAPMRFIGDISYTFYLWHWPVLALAAEQHGSDLSVGTNILLLAAALALSAGTYYLFENPIRRSERISTQPALVMWLASPVIVAAVVIFAQQAIDGKVLSAVNGEVAAAAARAPSLLTPAAPETPAQKRYRLQQQALIEQLAATGKPLPSVMAADLAATANRVIPAGLTPSPATGDLAKDIYKLPPECTAGERQTTNQLCKMGDTAASRTMVVFGDSHAQMWMPAIMSTARREHWTVIPVIKVSCTIRMWGGDHPKPGCTAWYKWATGQAAKLRPDLTIIAGRYLNEVPGVPPAMASVTSALGALIPKLELSSKRVVVMGDVFGEQQLPVDCLLRSHSKLGDCSSPYDSARILVTQTVAQLAKAHGAGFINPTGWFCGQRTCPVVIGRTVAYFDNSHITKTYGAELAAPFDAAFRAAIKQ